MSAIFSCYLILFFYKSLLHFIDTFKSLFICFNGSHSGFVFGFNLGHVLSFLAFTKLSHFDQRLDGVGMAGEDQVNTILTQHQAIFYCKAVNGGCYQSIRLDVSRIFG